MNAHQKVIQWITSGMKIGFEYQLSEQQMELLADCMQAFIIPTLPCDEYTWYLQFGEGYKTVKKHLIIKQ